MDPMHPAAPVARPRPTAVTVSSYLLYAVAAVTLLNAVLALSFVGRTADVYRDAYAGSPAAGTEGLIVAASVITAVVYVLFAVGLVVLALFNNRGRNPARITTWVVGGISLCCSGLVLGGNAMTGSFNMPGCRTRRRCSGGSTRRCRPGSARSPRRSAWSPCWPSWRR
jgi:preprotein translocase subunit SecG